MIVARTKARPIRTCVGCGCRDSQRDLLRLQVPPGDGLALATRPLRGRSGYVHDRRPCIEGIVKSRILRRSLRVDVPRAVRVATCARLLERMDDRAMSLPGAQSVLS